jgi:hypothetical protein
MKDNTEWKAYTPLLPSALFRSVGPAPIRPSVRCPLIEQAVKRQEKSCVEALNRTAQACRNGDIRAASKAAAEAALKIEHLRIPFTVGSPVLCAWTEAQREMIAAWPHLARELGPQFTPLEEVLHQSLARNSVGRFGHPSDLSIWRQVADSIPDPTNPDPTPTPDLTNPDSNG